MAFVSSRSPDRLNLRTRCRNVTQSTHVQRVSRLSAPQSVPTIRNAHGELVNILCTTPTVTYLDNGLEAQIR